LSYYILY